MVQSLSPGAVVLITVPADMRLWSAHDEGLLHRRRYDEAMLRATWRGLPLEPLAVTHFCTRVYPLARLQRRLGDMRDRVGRRREGWEMQVPAAPLNRLLERAFAGESRRLVEIVQGRRRASRARGVSLLAVLRRTGTAYGARPELHAGARA
jgi:hypothetical protein